jgi:glycosyltransferase involved in cell wall biosynthesis
MRLLYVVPSYYPATVYGGPIFSIHAAAGALAALAIDVHVATTNANGDGKLEVPTDIEVKLAENYRVHYYDDTITNRFSWAFTKGLAADVRAADVVHLQDVFSAHAAWCFFLAWYYSKPLMVSVRGVFTPWGLEGKRPWLKKIWLALLVQPFVKDQRRVMWHATAESERIETKDVFIEARTVVIPNGIDCNRFDEVQAYSRFDYLKQFFSSASVPASEAIVLLAMGRLHKKKSFETAIAAVAKLIHIHPQLLLLIAGGDDGEGEALSALIAGSGLHRNVALVGEVKGADKIQFLKGGDILLFPTHNENFGMVALEALAAGIPVVASKNAPWDELERQQTGLWVENSADAFAAAIEQLLSGTRSAIARSSIKERARAHAGQYDLGAVARAFETSYRELLHGTGNRR